MNKEIYERLMELIVVRRHKDEPEMQEAIRIALDSNNLREYNLPTYGDEYFNAVYKLMVEYCNVPISKTPSRDVQELLYEIQMDDSYFEEEWGQQTVETCLMAMVVEPGWFADVEHKTPELCKAAVELWGETLQWIEDQTFDLCLTAVQDTTDALAYIKNPEIRKKVKEALGAANNQKTGSSKEGWEKEFGDAWRIFGGSEKSKKNVEKVTEALTDAIVDAIVPTIDKQIDKVMQSNDEEDLAKALSGLPGLMAGGLFGTLGDVISSVIKQLDSETTQNLMKAQGELAAALREQKEILKQWQDVADDWAAALSEMIDVNNRIAEVAKKGNGSNLLSPEFASLREKTEEAEHRINMAASNYSEIAAKAGEQHKKVEKAVQKFKEAEAESNEEDIETVTNSLNRSRASLMNDAGTSSMNVSWESLMNDACNENSLEGMGNIKLF